MNLIRRLFPWFFKKDIPLLAPENKSLEMTGLSAWLPDIDLAFKKCADEISENMYFGTDRTREPVYYCAKCDEITVGVFSRHRHRNRSNCVPYIGDL